jgi:hypothetical protein
MKRAILSVILFCATFSLIFAQTNESDTEKFFNKKYIRSTMDAAVKWQFTHPKHDVRDRTNGAFLLAGSEVIKLKR